jgi:hypothetical protein
MIPWTETERAVYYPQDRRFRFWICPAAVQLLIVLAVVPLVCAWLQQAFWGLLYFAPNPASASGAASGPHGFPVWIRWCHFFNLFFTFMLIRSGLSILMDHPRLYFNDGCTPGTEWIRFTPLKVPTDRMWTAKDDNRYISPLLGCPAIAILSGLRVAGISSPSMVSFLPASFSLPDCSAAISGSAWCRPHGRCSSRRGTRS